MVLEAVMGPVYIATFLQHQGSALHLSPDASGLAIDAQGHGSMASSCFVVAKFLPTSTIEIAPLKLRATPKPQAPDARGAVAVPTIQGLPEWNDTMTDTTTHSDRRPLWGAPIQHVAPGTTLRWSRKPGPPDDDETPGPNPNPNPVVRHDTRAQVVVRRLYCSCTTESGHDEVYYLVGGVNGAGHETSHRGPDGTQSGDADNATAWDLNDSGDQQTRRINAVIYDEALLPGQTATFVVAFFESDGQDWGSTVAGAGKLASSVGASLKNPIVSIAGQAVSWLGGFIPKNQDDALGALSFRLGNHGGTVGAEEMATGSYTSIVHSLDHTTGTFSVRFRHDDGDYTVDFQVTGR